MQDIFVANLELLEWFVKIIGAKFKSIERKNIYGRMEIRTLL